MRWATVVVLAALLVPVPPPPTVAPPSDARGVVQAAVTTRGGCGLAVQSVPWAEPPSLLATVVGDRVSWLVDLAGGVWVVRDGRVDRGVGHNGRVRGDAVVRDAVLAGDDALLMALAAPSGNARVPLLQLLPDGTPDPAFGDDGQVEVPLGGGLFPTSGDSPRGLFRLADGDVLVISGTPSLATIVRLNRDGSTDPDFGQDGRLDFPTSGPIPDRAVVMPDGGFVLLADDDTHGAAWRVSRDGTVVGSSATDTGEITLDAPPGRGGHAALDHTRIAVADVGLGRLGTITLTSGEVDVRDGPRIPLGGQARLVGGEFVIAGFQLVGEGLFFENSLSWVRVPPDGAPQGDAARFTPFARVRLHMALRAGVAEDGSVLAAAFVPDWQGRPSFASVALDADGREIRRHGWCPDDDRREAPTVERLAGPDRYGTAVAVARDAFPDGADEVLLATGASFPDALAGGPLAARLSAPVLLTEPHRLPGDVADELSRLSPRRVTVLGGPSAVSDDVAAAAGAAADAPVRRVAGDDRYDTAAAVSRASHEPGVDVVFVATGDAFPDALAAGAVAGTLAGPLLLTRAEGLPAATRQELQRLTPDAVVVVGGENAVGASLDDIRRLHGNAVEVVRGDDRYATARALVDTFRDEVDGAVGRPVTTAFLTTGTDFPDALAGAAAAAVAGGVVLLVEPQMFDERVRRFLGRVDPGQLYVLGGTQAVGPVWTEVLSAPEATSFTWIIEPFGPSRPVRWDPCVAIPWQFNPQDAPAIAARSFVAEMLAAVSEETGWDFDYVGRTDRSPTATPTPGPIVIGWADIEDTGSASITWTEDVADGGTIALNASLDRDLDTDDGDWGEAILHEVGHVLGLGHAGDRTQNMYFAGGDFDGVVGLTPGDLTGLRHLHDLGCQ